MVATDNAAVCTREQVDPRGPRFGGAVTTVVLALALVFSGTTLGTILIAWQTLVFALGAIVGLQAQPYGIFFRKVIRPQRPLLTDLERVKQRYLAADLDLEIYFDDIVDAQERIWDMLENYKEVVEALEESNEAVISHRVNDILRVLTSISVIVLPLTLLASIWGMNVGVPGQGDGTAFWVVIGLMAGLLIGMVAWFRKRGWL